MRYNCRDGARHLQRVIETLSRTGVINNPPMTFQIQTMTTQCAPCLAHEGQNACLGWTTEVATPLELGPFADKGTTVVLRVTGRMDFRRSSPMTPGEWEAEPLYESVVTVETDEHSTAEHLSRHHYDLANSGQPGPIWHLQVGGKGTPKPRRDLPRSLSLPMDIALVLDHLVFNYNRPAWQQMNMEAAYRRSILVSETLIQRAWVARVSQQLAREVSNRSESILRILDNEAHPTGSPVWDPRPARNL